MFNRQSHHIVVGALAALLSIHAIPAVAAPPQLVDRVLTENGPNDCSDPARAEAALRFDYHVQIEERIDGMKQKLRDPGLAPLEIAEQALCLARFERALGMNDAGVVNALLTGLMALEPLPDAPRARLALEAALSFIEQGKPDAARALLARHSAAITRPDEQRRAKLLAAMLDSAPAKIKDLLTSPDTAPIGAYAHETALIAHDFLARHYRASAQTDLAKDIYQKLLALADHDKLFERRFVVASHAGLAEIAFAAAQWDVARAEIEQARAMATTKEDSFFQIANPNGDLAFLNAKIARGAGADLVTLFPRESVANEPVGDYLYADWSLEFGGQNAAEQAQILSLYRDLHEARGRPDIIARPSIPDIPQLPALAFQLAQSLHHNEAAEQADFANLLRQADDSEERTRLIAADQDKANLNAQLESYALLSANMDAAATTKQTAAFFDRYRQFNAALQTGEQDIFSTEVFRDAIHPWYLAMRQLVDRKLGEEFLLIVPVGNDIHVFVQGQQYRGESNLFAWHRLVDGVAKTTPLIDRLRCQLDSDGCDPAARALWEAEDMTLLEQMGQRSFDRDVAYQLYDMLIRPVEAALTPGADVFVMALGKMASLPLALLATERPGKDSDPADYQAMARAKWLGDRYAFTSVPSFASFRPDRFRPLNNSSDQMLFAVANPAFSGDSAAAALHDAAFMTAGRGGVLADISQIKRLRALPGTLREYDAIAAALASEQKIALLGIDANEDGVRQNPALGSARYILFATHGLLPGQNKAGLTEPALVFTPPETATPENDGLLTASEVLDLRLRADWVILSACNTASVDSNDNGESLSTLASAFLKAGALQILASHWAVRDDVTAMLTTAALKASIAAPKKGPGRALQSAMRTIRTGKNEKGKAVDGWKADWAHPTSWAPFVVISNGDEAIVNNRFGTDEPQLRGGSQAASRSKVSSASLAATQRASAASCAATILPRRCDNSLIVKPA